MTTATISREKTPKVATAEMLTGAPVKTLLRNQQTLYPSGQGTDYNSIADTNIEPVSTEQLRPGMLLYDPRNADAALEVISLYENDFGEQKVRVRVHSSDYRDERLHSYFTEQVERDLSVITLRDASSSDDAEETTQAQWTPESVDGGTASGQAQALLVNTTPANENDGVSTSTSKPTEETTDTTEEENHIQQTLF